MRSVLAACLTVLVAMIPTAPAAAAPLKMGATTILHDSDDATRLRVRVYQPVDPLVPSDPASAVDPGRREVGVYVSIKNINRFGIRLWPSLSATVVTRGGVSLTPEYVTLNDGCPAWEQTAILRGQTRRSCIVFEVAAPSRLRWFELDFGGKPGQWKMP